MSLGMGKPINLPENTEFDCQKFYAKETFDKLG